tara:strand:- start:585 stop:806 length:222 start_codon:yes stop_codon:yes gene_type:complete
MSDNERRVPPAIHHVPYWEYMSTAARQRTTLKNQSVHDEYPYYEHDCDLVEMIDDISARLHILRKKLQLKSPL